MLQSPHSRVSLIAWETHHLPSLWNWSKVQRKLSSPFMEVGSVRLCVKWMSVYIKMRCCFNRHKRGALPSTRQRHSEPGPGTWGGWYAGDGGREGIIRFCGDESSIWGSLGVIVTREGKMLSPGTVSNFLPIAHTAQQVLYITQLNQTVIFKFLRNSSTNVTQPAYAQFNSSDNWN